MKKISLILITFLLCMQNIQAKDFKLLLQTELGYGGEELVVSSKGSDMNAGDGLYYGIGTIFKTLENREDLHTALTIGWILDWRFIEDGDNLFSSKIPITITEYYTSKNWRFGAGVTYHTAHKLHGNEIIPDLKFDNAFGGVVSVGYLVNKAKNLHYGLRATIIDYTVNNYTGNGNRFALFIESQL